MGKLLNKKTMNIVNNYRKGTLRCAEFAVTNTCIAKCSFCSIWKEQPKIFVDTEKAKKAINRMADLGVSHICFTGGEALMHPDIIELVQTATDRNIYSAVLVAAPQLLLKEGMLQKLDEAGADLLSISFDSGDPALMAKQRQIPGIMNQMADALGEIRKTSMKTMASTLIYKDNYKCLEQVFKKAQDMGFDFVSVNYPTFSESSTYMLGGDGIDFPKETLIESLETIIKLKNSGKYRIINNAASMQNIINYLKDPATAKFPCFGGRRVFFVDWNFNVFPCMQLPNSLGDILDVTEKDLDLAPCNKCNMSWYRDISAYFCGAHSIPLLLEAAKNSRGLVQHRG